MNIEKQKILKMLADQKISVVEADRLLGATQPGQGLKPPAGQKTQTPPQKKRTWLWVLLIGLLMLLPIILVAGSITITYVVTSKSEPTTVRMGRKRVLTELALKKRERQERFFAYQEMLSTPHKKTRLEAIDGLKELLNEGFAEKKIKDLLQTHLETEEDEEVKQAIEDLTGNQ